MVSRRMRGVVLDFKTGVSDIDFRNRNNGFYV